MNSTLSDSILSAFVGAGATLVALYFYANRKRHEAFFEQMPGTPLMHRGEDVCIWCGHELPEPEHWDAYDPIYQRAIKPWVMKSYGDGRLPIMACSDMHMELWYMTGPYKEKVR